MSSHLGFNGCGAFSPLHESEGQAHRHIKDNSPQGGAAGLWSSPSLCSPCPLRVSSTLQISHPSANRLNVFQMYWVGASVPQPLCLDGHQKLGSPEDRASFCLSSVTALSIVCRQPQALLGSKSTHRCAVTCFPTLRLCPRPLSCSLTFLNHLFPGPTTDFVVNNNGVHSRVTLKHSHHTGLTVL